MRAKIVNVAAIRQADLDLSGPITLILGANQSGKTLARNAIAAALMGSAKIYGVTKETAASIVGPAGDTAFVTVSYDDETAMTVRWPKATVYPKGEVRTYGAIVCGLVTPLELDGAKWRAFLAKCVGIDESAIDPEDWIPDLPKSAPIDLIKAEVEGLGWDGAAEGWTDLARTSRSEWAKLTSRRFGANPDGSDNVHHWVHANDSGEHGDLLEVNMARLEELGDLIDAHRVAAKHPVLESRELAILKRQASMGKLQEQHAEAVGKVQRIELQMQQQGKEYDCPHCGGVIRFESGKLVQANEAEHKHPLEQLRGLREDASVAANEIMKQIGQVQTAQIKLAGILEAAKAAEPPPGQLAAIEIEHGQLEKSAIGRRVTCEAQSICETARSQNRIATFLSTDGWRRDRIIAALGDVKDPASFNGMLHSMTKVMFGAPAAIDVDDKGLRLTWRGLSYKTLTWCSDASSTMLRLTACMQIISAKTTGAPCVLIDRFDTLDPVIRQKFMTVMKGAGVPVVLFCTALQCPPADVLAEAGIGRMYWIENGEITPVDSSDQSNGDGP